MAEARWALVTGAAGFLGRPLCDGLRKAGYRVVAVDRCEAVGPWHELRVLDLTAPEAFEGLCDGIDVVFHLAAKTHAVAAAGDEEADYRRLNVEMTERLVAAAVAADVGALVLMSSVKVLGEGSEQALGDDDPPRPTTPYGRTKLAAEELVHAAGREHGLHTCVLRAPLMYGPGVKGNLQNMIEGIARRRFPPLPETGNRRSLVDVRDVARALLLVAEASAANGRTYVVTDGQLYSTRRIQDLVRSALGRPPLAWALPRGVFGGLAAIGEVLHGLGLPFPFDRTACEKLLGSAVYTSTAITAELGFQPRYDLDQALSGMLG